jgi:hypothetical protein
MGNINPFFWCKTIQDTTDTLSIVIDLNQQSNEIVIPPLNLNDSIKEKKSNNIIKLDDYLMNSGFI